jgi:glycosyltransferase involved in cell wall biosynthesis
MADFSSAHAFVVPAYGDSPFLHDCLGSLRSQSVASRVVIATSTPSEFIDEAASRFGVDLVVNPRADGIARDWNFALQSTDARYVTLAHQDDLYFPQFLARSLELLAASSRSVLCFTGYLEIDDDGRPKVSRISLAKHLIEAITLGGARCVGGSRLRSFLSFGNPLPCSSVTFDRSRLGDFAFSSDYHSNLDWEAWLQLLRRGESFVRTPERLVGRRHNLLTETAKLQREGRRQTEDLAIFRKLWPRPIADVLAFCYRAGYRFGR